MDAIVELIYSLFDRFSYSALFFGVMLDNLGIPIPAELVLMFAGSLVAKGDFAIVPAIIIAASGAFLSDSAWFFAGRIGARRLIQLYCRISFGSTACMARTEANLMRFGPRSLLYARFIPGFRTFASPMAGMSGMPYRWFALYAGIGALLWSSLGVWTGYLFAREFTLIVDRFKDVQFALVYVAGAGLLMFLLMKWFIRRLHGRAQIRLATVDAVPVQGRPAD